MPFGSCTRSMFTSMTRPVKTCVTSSGSTCRLRPRPSPARTSAGTGATTTCRRPGSAPAPPAPIHRIAPVSDSFTQPHDTMSQMSAANSASASTMPSGPIELSVARRNTNQPISSTTPSTASSGVICGKARLQHVHVRIAARVVREQHQRQRERCAQQEAGEGQFFHVCSPLGVAQPRGGASSSSGVASSSGASSPASSAATGSRRRTSMWPCRCDTPRSPAARPGSAPCRARGR